MNWKFWKRKKVEESAVEMDLPIDTDNINAAAFAYQIVAEIDPMLYPVSVQKRIKRIKRNISPLPVFLFLLCLAWLVSLVQVY